jgi:dUTP pyrophosphatase
MLIKDFLINEVSNVKIKLLPGGKIPTKANEFASGFDLYANFGELDCLSILPGEVIKIRTGVCLEIPVGLEAVLRPRSGLSSKGVYVATGTIDCDYRGEISAVLANVSMKPYKVTNGDRIAQIVFQIVPSVSLVEVSELSETERGDKGFGSSGK